MCTLNKELCNQLFHSEAIYIGVDKLFGKGLYINTIPEYHDLIEKCMNYISLKGGYYRLHR